MRHILALLFCLLITSAKAADHSTLTIGVQQFPATFNPNTDSLAIKEYVLGFARPYLTAYDKDWKLTCYLCVRLPSYEDGTAHVETGTDGRQQVVERYTLQPQAKWDDGVPVTTADVLFTYEAGKYPKSGYAHAELYQGDTASTIADIKAIDAKTFEVRLKGVPCQYQDLSDFYIVPEHIEGPIFRADPDLYRLHTMYDMDPTARGLYYGPYRISHVERGSSIDLTRNPTWWGKRPAFDRIHIQAFDNTSTMQSALVSGQVDYLPGEVGIPENIALSIQRRYAGKYNVVFKPTLTDQHLDLDAANPLFADLRVRKALLLAIDRDTANTAIYDGLYKPQTSFLSPLDPLFTADVATYGFDPKQAAALLGEAGWKPGADGVRVDGKGERLSFTLMTTSGDQRREELEQILAWYWKQVGVEARIVNQPARILFGQTLPHHLSTGAALYSWMTAPGNIPRSIYGTANIPSAENGWSGENFLGWSNPQMDSLLTRMETVCEPAANKAAWDEAQRLYTEQLPSLPLYYRSSAYVMPNWLKGVEPTGHQVPSSMWVQDWGVE